MKLCKNRLPNLPLKSINNLLQKMRCRDGNFPSVESEGIMKTLISSYVNDKNRIFTTYGNFWHWKNPGISSVSRT